ncbi:hypothetical protein ABTM01_20360, partial [Acinetobacter baumannii]
MLNATLDPEANGAGGSYPNAVDSPQVPIPPNNVPRDRISMAGPPLTSGEDGIATMSFSYRNPENPRGYIDGQI